LSELSLDPYEVLEVSPRASHDVIAAAYRALARRYHPDVSTDPADVRRMVVINQAWEMLQSPERRARHDRERALQTGGGNGSPAVHTHAATMSAAEDPASGGYPPGNGAYRPGGHPQEAGPGRPHGLPFGSRLGFGRYHGWTLGQILRVDSGYLFWLERQREGQPYAVEIDGLLKRAGLRLGADGRRLA
jgi:curved DNA-binding protein CbpA